MAHDSLAEHSGNAHSSTQLLKLAQTGDRDALDRLVARYLPRLRRWARGRLPSWARDLAETADLVQDTLVRTFKHVDTLEPREGALQAYLRQVLLNRLREEIRRVRRRPAPETLDEQYADEEASPLERAIGREGIDRYESALQRLRPHEREAIIMRVELGCSYEEVAVALGKPNANAARSSVVRALDSLTREMGYARQ